VILAYDNKAKGLKFQNIIIILSVVQLPCVGFVCRDADPLKSGPGISDPMEGDSDEDEESLNEYGDIDAGKFTEDGSFIGDYHSEQRNRGRPGDSYA